MEETAYIVCNPCWDGRNKELDTHECHSNPEACELGMLCPDFIVFCNCPCDS